MLNKFGYYKKSVLIKKLEMLRSELIGTEEEKGIFNTGNDASYRDGIYDALTSAIYLVKIGKLSSEDFKSS